LTGIKINRLSVWVAVQYGCATVATLIVIAIDPWPVASVVVLPMECHDSINTGALCTLDSGDVFCMKVEDDIAVGVRLGARWILILEAGINLSRTVTSR
jgi:hypothetical protein